MTGRHAAKRIAGNEMDLRVARVVLRALRDAGIEAEYFDHRDERGARFIPANLRLKGALPGQTLWVLVRRLGANVTLLERAWMRQNQPCRIQYGAHDVAELVAWIRAHQASHWGLSTKD